MTTVTLYLAALSATLSSIASGTFFGWTSPAFALYNQTDSPIRLEPIDKSRISSFLLIGIGIGCLFSAPLANKIGRKLTMLLGIIPTCISWLIIAYATNPRDLIISRTVSGLGIATAYSTLPMYISEVSPASIRGFLLTGLRIAAKIGILIEFSYGPSLSIKLGAFVSLVFPLLFGCTLMWLPESPYYLTQRGQHQLAKKSLSKFHDKIDVKEELETIEKSISSLKSSRTDFKDIFFVPGNRKALCIPLMLSLIQQASGTQAITSFVQEIFNAGNPTFLSPEFLTIIFGSVTVIATFVCAILVDKQGRRVLLIVSSVGCCLTMFLLAVYYHLENNHSMMISVMNGLPTIGIILNTIMFSVGLAALPLAIMSEVFAPNVKALGCSIVVVFASFTCGLVTYLHPIIQSTFGLHVNFYIYAISSALGSVYIYFCVPETRLKSLQEIQNEINSS